MLRVGKKRALQFLLDDQATYSGKKNAGHTKMNTNPVNGATETSQQSAQNGAAAPDAADVQNFDNILNGSSDRHFGYGVKADLFVRNENGYRDRVISDIRDSGNRGILTTENLMKPENMVDSAKREQARQFVKAAKEANIDDIRGHALSWHRQGDPEMAKLNDGDRDAGLKRLDEFIGGMMRDFGDDVKTWDVVNEAFNENGTKRHLETDARDKDGNPLINESFRVIGDDAMAETFESARKHNPDAKLMYNDFNLEGNTAKFDAVLTELKKINDEYTAAGGVGKLVNGMGFQAHLKAEDVNQTTPANGEQLTFMQKFADHIQKARDAGLEVHVTEIDIRGDVDITDEARKVGALLHEKNVDYAQWWNTDDAKSWVHDEHPGPNNFPTLRDNDADGDGIHNRKAAFEAFTNAYNGRNGS